MDKEVLIKRLVTIYSMGRRLQIGALEEPSPDLTPSGAFGVMSKLLEDLLIEELGKDELIARLRSHPRTEHLVVFLEDREDTLPQ